MLRSDQTSFSSSWFPLQSKLHRNATTSKNVVRASSQDNAAQPLRSASDATEAVVFRPRKDNSGATTPIPEKKYSSNYIPKTTSTSPAAASESDQEDGAWLPGLPPFPRMTPEDERLANEEGHFFRRLLEAGLVDKQGNITELGAVKVAPMNASYIHLTINKMLSMNRRYQTVIAVVRDVGSYMGGVNIATAMHRLGRLVRNARAWSPSLPDRMVAHPQYQYLLRRAEEVIGEMGPRALANFLWGMAALGDEKNTGIVLRAGRRLLTIEPGELKTQELSNILWSMATLEVHEPELVNRILDSACDRIDDCVPQALSNMIWACATLRHTHPRFPQVVAASATPRLATFQSQTLANTLWAYSVLGKYPTELFNQAAEEIVRRLALKEARESSKENGGGSFVEDEDPSFSQFQGQEISNVLIAYARGCIIHPGLLQALEKELCRSVEVTRDGEVVQIERLKEFTSQALANTLWAFATLRWYPARLLPSITEAIGSLVDTMTAQELANSLWAYARFAYHPGRVMASFLSVMERRISEFEGQGCTNSLWALAVLKATHSAAFVELLQRYVALERSAGSFGELQYNQVLQAVLLAQFEARGGRVAWRPEVDLPESVVDRALAAWASQQMSTQLSGFHLDVSEGLTRLAVPHLLEYLVARDLLSIDIAVIDDGRKLAIEVDGPFHFPVNARTPLGHTMIRRRLLRAAGWTVLSIPWYEWFAMNTWEERLQYLTTVLSRADQRFADSLRPATRELLSTNFAPGPGVEADSETANSGDLSSSAAINPAAAGVGLSGGPEQLGSSSRRSLSLDESTSSVPATSSYDESEDGPVLSYYKHGSIGSSGVDNGLMQVLSRSNVQLTSGAMRRLQSMGLDDLVREVGERRKANGNGDYVRPRGPEVYAPPPSVQYSDGDPMLMPKPRLPKPSSKSFGGGGSGSGDGRRSTRFTPRFMSENSSNWGYFPPAEEAVAAVARRVNRKSSGKKRANRATNSDGNSGSNQSEEMLQRVLHGKGGSFDEQSSSSNGAKRAQHEEQKDQEQPNSDDAGS